MPESLLLLRGGFCAPPPPVPMAFPLLQSDVPQIPLGTETTVGSACKDGAFAWQCLEPASLVFSVAASGPGRANGDVASSEVAYPANLTYRGSVSGQLGGGGRGAFCAFVRPTADPLWGQTLVARPGLFLC